VTPSSGTISRERDTINVGVNLAGLKAGNYTTNVILTLAGVAKSIPISLTVGSSTSGGTTGTSGGTTGTASLSWTANTETDLAGYKVYRATASGAYGVPIATLNNSTTSYVASGLQQGMTYFFVITAYDTAANESPFSIEVTKTVN
jgi:fibronectin type 3 domain-containing protein